MSDLFSVKDKVVVITGGAGFLGKQYAKALEEAGALVAVWDRQGIARYIDITDFDEVKREVELLLNKFERIDILINNAALNPASSRDKNKCWTPYENFPLDLWDTELNINLTGAMIATQAVAPQMMKQRSGSIIFVASDLALIAPNNSIYDPGSFKDIAYVTSKAGILGLMRGWASYLGRYNIRVNALVPGGMYRNQPEEFVKKNSQLTMLGRMSREGEYNGPILFLASDASSYMTGACLVIDGGRTAW